MRYPHENSNRHKPPEDQPRADRDNGFNAENNHRNRSGNQHYQPGSSSGMVNPLLHNMNFHFAPEQNQGLQSPYFTNPTLHDNHPEWDQNSGHAAGYQNQYNSRDQHPNTPDNSETPDYQDRENYIRNRDRHAYPQDFSPTHPAKKT